MSRFDDGTRLAFIDREGNFWLKVLGAIAFVVATLLLQGCAAFFDDPLRASYEAGEISREEYEARRLERAESLARCSSAHSELLHMQIANQAKLPPK